MPKYMYFRYIIETTYGYYPLGTWGAVTQRATVEEAVATAKQMSKTFHDPYRAYDNETDTVLWSSEEEEGHE